MNVFDQLKDTIKEANRDGVPLGVLAAEAKVSRSTIPGWLYGRVMFPRVPTMLRVAEVLGKHVELTGDVQKFVNHRRKMRYKLWRLKRE